MDRQEYLESLEALDKEYQLCKKEFMFEYCRTNNPYKKGDIIQDHQGKGEVISWKPFFGITDPDGLPTIEYKCRVLKKDGTLPKKMEYRSIYLCNMTANEKDSTQA